jgi:hypothetical protein
MSTNVAHHVVYGRNSLLRRNFDFLANVLRKSVAENPVYTAALGPRESAYYAAGIYLYLPKQRIGARLQEQYIQRKR